jgi:hypothetical protein
MAITQVGRQNTRALTAGEQASYQMMGPLGGTVFSWDLFNAGPSDIWARWDGQGEAVANDPGSVWLPSGIGYTGAVTSLMTVVANAATTIVFVINNTG